MTDGRSPSATCGSSAALGTDRPCWPCPSCGPCAPCAPCCWGATASGVRGRGWVTFERYARTAGPSRLADGPYSEVFDASRYDRGCGRGSALMARQQQCQGMRNRVSVPHGAPPVGRVETHRGCRLRPVLPPDHSAAARESPRRWEEWPAMRDVDMLGAGMLLVASPELRDPHFRRSVVYLVAHGDDGAVGVILNRRSARPRSRTCCRRGRRTPPSRRPSTRRAGADERGDVPRRLPAGRAGAGTWTASSA